VIIAVPLAKVGRFVQGYGRKLNSDDCRSADVDFRSDPISIADDKSNLSARRQGVIVTPTNNSVTELTGLHLYHADMSNCSMRVRMVLKEKNLPWTSHHLDLRKKEAVTPEYFGIHPQGLVPTLVHDGVVHIESNDIIEYLDATFPDPPL
jgi:hypothetical protein